MDNPCLESENETNSGDIRHRIPSPAEKAAEESESKKIKKVWTWKSRITFLFRTLKQIRIEPIIFFHMVSLLVTNLAYSDFILGQICRLDLNYPDETCDALTARQTGNYTEEETAVQKQMAEITTWRFGIEYSVPTILVLFLGAWSDKHGRKFTLILPMVGTVIKTFGLLLCTYFDDWNGTIIALWYTIPSSVTGSYPLFAMAFYSYVSDVSTEEYRTVRFGIAGAFSSIGVAIGSSFGGFLLSRLKFNFANVFVLAGVLEVFVILAVFFLVENTKGGHDSGSLIESEKESWTWKSFISIFKITNIFNTFKILLVQRESHGRLKLWLFLLVFFCSAAPFYGESSVLYLFLRLKFGWDAGEFGFFALYQIIAALVGTFISSGILSYYFKVNDSYIGFFGCISQISSSLMYAFGESITMIYSAPLVDILNGAMVLAIRSMSTKTVDVDEQGKIISIFAGIDAVNPVISNVLYAAVYRITLDFFPGGFFLLSAILAVPPFFIYGYFSLAKLSGKT